MTLDDQKRLWATALPYVSLVASFGAAFGITQVACGTASHEDAAVSEAGTAPVDGGTVCTGSGCGGYDVDAGPDANAVGPPPPPSPDAGPVVGTVTGAGGSVSRLLFAVVGDTRPAMINDTAGYPSSVITGIYNDLAALNPEPSFVVTTGDYQFASPNSAECAVQVGLYVTARAAYKNPVFPTFGNHECTGADVSNCGVGNTDGITNNYTAFMKQLVQPLGYTKPYYEVDINATNKSWTSKFIYVAGNAWDSTQAAWLETALSRPTTYTFFVRHESLNSSPAPAGVSASEIILAKHPYTLEIVGHTHSYYHYKNSKEVLVGNGGAPLTSKSYGYAIISQRADGALVGDMVNATTKALDGYFHFVVKADGTPTP